MRSRPRTVTRFLAFLCVTGLVLYALLGRGELSHLGKAFQGLPGIAVGVLLPQGLGRLAAAIRPSSVGLRLLGCLIGAATFAALWSVWRMSGASGFAGQYPCGASGACALGILLIGVPAHALGIWASTQG